jgi:hypothetical protein
MGDDVTVVIPETQDDDPSTEEIGEELYNLLSSCMSRIDNLTIQIGEQNARIATLEGICGELSGRTWAEVGHTHEEFALAGHGHPEYAIAEHTHAEEHKERDHPPEKQHPWFRKLGE